jgi:alpha-L-fucosidase
MLQIALASIAAITAMSQVPDPKPYGVLPTARQIAHDQYKTYAFLHFSPNTFTNREWGQGDEDPNVFNPDDFDADQIVLALKAGGMKGAILTCKHHDGFCLWQTKTTNHSVASSSWMGGKGDVARAISEACKRHGLKFGIYVSPWDRNNAEYGKPAYVNTYREQLRELLTNYGPIFEVWHDGANGGDGYYGGANETRSIDRRTYYGWPTTWAEIRQLQPAATIFSDVGPDLRWVGNENGIAGETCWQTFSPLAPDGGAATPGDCKSDEATQGHRNGKLWLPAECDVSIRPGWFWHEAENSKVKSAKQLVDLYYQSVGRGAYFLLNVPPNRHGRIEQADAESLKEYWQTIQRTFATNLASGAELVPSNVRGNSPKFGVANLLADDPDRYWATDDRVISPNVEIRMPRPASFDVIRLKEHIALGQRVGSIAIDVWRNGAWAQVVTATSIGGCHLIRLDHPVQSDRVRLRITSSAACPALWGFGLFKAA